MKTQQHWRTMMTIFGAMVFLVAIPGNRASAQEPAQISNVRFEASPDQIIITYDLLNTQATDQTSAAMPTGSKQYRVSMFVRKESDQSFVYQPKFVTGEIGKQIVEGKNRKIVWNVALEFPDGIEGSDFFFEVRAEPLEVQSNSLRWILASGAAVLGGAVAYLFLSKGAPASGGSFPDPPGRPR